MQLCTFGLLKVGHDKSNMPVLLTFGGSQLRYCGTTAPPVGFDDVLIQGDLDKAAFAAFYCKVDKVVAVASMGYDPAVSLSALLMRQRRMPTKTQLKVKDIKTFAAQ